MEESSHVNHIQEQFLIESLNYPPISFLKEMIFTLNGKEQKELSHLQDTAAHHWYLISAVTSLPEMII